MAGRKVTDGQSVRVTVPQNSNIPAGNFALVQGFFGMAVQEAITGAGQTKDIALNIEEAEYETNQITVADAFAKGDKVYWNAGTGLLTTAPNNDADGNPQNRLVGRVTVAKDGNNYIWMKLGPQMQAHA